MTLPYLFPAKGFQSRTIALDEGLYLASKRLFDLAFNSRSEVDLLPLLNCRRFMGSNNAIFHNLL